jgi:hypothetical protein
MTKVESNAIKAMPDKVDNTPVYNSGAVGSNLKEEGKEKPSGGGMSDPPAGDMFASSGGMFASNPFAAMEAYKGSGQNYND